MNLRVRFGLSSRGTKLKSKYKQYKQIIYGKLHFEPNTPANQFNSKEEELKNVLTSRAICSREDVPLSFVPKRGDLKLGLFLISDLRII